jgi:hypothetical protein
VTMRRGKSPDDDFEDEDSLPSPAPILPNVTAHFYAHNSASATPTRIKPFSLCNTSTSFFGQARAAKLFAKPDFKVVAVSIDNGDERLCLIDADGEDFQAFVEVVKRAAGWAEDTKATSCVVSVREEK